MDDNSKRMKFSVSIYEVSGLIEAMKEHEIKAYTQTTKGLAFDSIYYDIFVDVVKSPYFIPSVSAAFVAYLKRNDKKQVRVKTKSGQEISLKGYSTKEVQKIIEDADRIIVDEEKPT